MRYLIFTLFALGLATLWSSTFTVGEYEQAIRTRFGEIRGETVTDAGLHFKAPFIDRIRRFDKRWLEWDGDPNQIPTRDKKYIWVDTYARWRIADPVRFYKALQNEIGAQSRLDDIIDGEVRNVIANHDLIEAVRSSSREFQKDDLHDEDAGEAPPSTISIGRKKLRELVLEKASSVMPEYGIELTDVRIKRINYVKSVQVKVFERMISERKRIAERYRSEGQGKSAEILGKIERELKTIQSEAYEKAEEIRGRGDAEALTIYAEAFGADPEFYRFTKTLETYEAAIGEDTTLVLSTQAELLRYLDSASGGR